MPKDLDYLNIDYYNLFKDAYSPCGLGAHVNMYIPAGPIAEVIGLAKFDDKAIVPHNNKYVYHTLYGNDVNSLYPCAMKSFNFPKILIAKFIGDIRFTTFNWMHESSGYVGIYKVKAYTPLYLKNPILPSKNEKGTVNYPLGNWVSTNTSAKNITKCIL